MNSTAPALILLTSLCAAASAQQASTAAFRLSAAPAAIAAPTVPPALSSAAIDRSALDIDAIEKYDDAVKFEQTGEDPADKAGTWRSLGQGVPALAETAEERANAWEAYATKSREADAADLARREARNADWQTLAPLLSSSAVKNTDKRAWAILFDDAYRNSPGFDYTMTKTLIRFLPPGAARDALLKQLHRPPGHGIP